MHGTTMDEDLRGTGGALVLPAYGDLFAGRGLSGRSFGRGLFRFHDSASVEPVQENLQDGFPDYAPVLDPFAHDWLGRQYVASSRAQDDLPGGTVLRIDVSTLALEAICDIDAFPTVLEHPTFPDFCGRDLLADFLRASSLDGLAVDQCAGWKVPEAFGGSLTVDNLEAIDEDVYWSVSLQVWARAETMAEGEAVRDVTGR